jgi:phosphoribosylglycinamide formyltransferase 2
VLVEGKSTQVEFGALESVLDQPDTQLRLFGKPEVNGHRRMGVVLARGESVEAALVKARTASGRVSVTL